MSLYRVVKKCFVEGFGTLFEGDVAEMSDTRAAHVNHRYPASLLGPIPKDGVPTTSMIDVDPGKELEEQERVRQN